MNKEERNNALINLESRISDFVEKVHPIFEKMGWTYYDGLPTKERLEGTCYTLISECFRNNYNHSSTGRIQVRVYEGTVDKKVKAILELVPVNVETF